MDAFEINFSCPHGLPERRCVAFVAWVWASGRGRPLREGGGTHCPRCVLAATNGLATQHCIAGMGIEGRDCCLQGHSA